MVEMFSILKTSNHHLKTRDFPLVFKTEFSFTPKFETTLLFFMRFLNETRVALLLSMHKVCMTLVNVEINFKTAARFLTFT